MEIGTRVKIKNQAIFGLYYGKGKKGLVYFLDEETNKMILIKPSKLIKTYTK